MKIKVFLIAVIGVLCCEFCFSQPPNDATPSKTKTYFSIVHPISTFSGGEHTFNFRNSYKVGFPVGINFIQNQKIAYSIEFVPSIVVNDTTSRLGGLLFHPGVIYRNIAGFNLLTRLASTPMADTVSQLL